ncbi:hypothetical protein L0Z26_07600 [Burkholderia multivorans]|nr:hypothetical protein [Burkholderia multivorans]MCO1341790.1 hypothetical protein [Burkholderia multivorans]
MKKLIPFIAAAALGLGVASAAQAHVSIGVGIGVPVAPAYPVYAPPPPVYYAPPPPPVVYAPAPAYYAPPAVVVGGYYGRPYWAPRLGPSRLLASLTDAARGDAARCKTAHRSGKGRCAVFHWAARVGGRDADCREAERPTADRLIALRASLVSARLQAACTIRSR